MEQSIIVEGLAKLAGELEDVRKEYDALLRRLEATEANYTAAASGSKEEEKYKELQQRLDKRAEELRQEIRQIRQERAQLTAQLQGPQLRRSKLKADRNEGIMARLDDNVCCKRRETVRQLLELAEEKGFVLLKAPPRSGKTSLLQLLEMEYTALQGCVYSVNMTDKPPTMTWQEFFEQQTKQSWQSYRLSGSGSSSHVPDDKVVLVLIDELQYAYPTSVQQGADHDPMDELWTFIKRLAAGDARARQTPLRIVAAAVYGDAPSYGVAGSAATSGMLRSHAGTPFELGSDRQVRLHRSELGQPALAYTAAEYEELWALTWGQREAELFSGTATKDDIFWVTAGQPGLVAFILDGLQQSMKLHSKRPIVQAGDQPQHLCDLLFQDMFRTNSVYEALQGTRSFLRLHEVSDSTAVQWRIFRPLIAAGFGVEGSPAGAPVALLSDEDRPLLAKCLKKGYLISHHHLGSELYSCNTPLHLLYLQHQMLSARAEHVQKGPLGLAAFVRVMINRLSPQQLLHTLSVGSAAAGAQGGGGSGDVPSERIVLERKLHMDLHAAALSLVPRGWNVCPDVGKVYGSTGLVDMWVSDPTRTVQWALEFIRNGSNLSEHERRFQPGGKYYNLPATEYVLIDFRTPMSARPQARLGQEATYFVLFEAGYAAACMYRASDMSLIWGPDSLLGGRG